MSIDTTFKPQGPTALVVATAIQVPNGGSGITSFRVRNLATVAQYFSWGKTAAQATLLAGIAPIANTPSFNTIGMLPSSVETFEIPGDSFFIAGTVTGFEFTAGQGS